MSAADLKIEGFARLENAVRQSGPAIAPLTTGDTSSARP